MVWHSNSQVDQWRQQSLQTDPHICGIFINDKEGIHCRKRKTVQRLAQLAIHWETKVISLLFLTYKNKFQDRLKNEIKTL